jgi:hypothetical protein
MLFSNMLAAIRVRSSRISALKFELCATLPADNRRRGPISVPGGDLTGLRFKSSSVHGPVAGLAVQEVKAANGPSLVHDLSAIGAASLTWLASVGKLRCLGHKRLLPIRRSARRVVVVLGVIRMSQRSQIECLKFSRLRNKRLFRCTDQCEYDCFHILCSFLFFFRLAPSLFRPLRDNYHCLCPIRKSDSFTANGALREAQSL